MTDLEKLLARKKEILQRMEEIKKDSKNKENIFKALYNQRFYYVINNPEIMIDIKEGILIPNPQYFKFYKRKEVYQNPSEVVLFLYDENYKKKISSLVIGGYKSWKDTTKEYRDDVFNRIDFKNDCFYQDELDY